ncbi:hypothetical protein ACFZAC_15150 [Pseudomonas fluorescens]|uniref:AbiTii domain-containing protein n=1 Tax=Pseudomonas fluorescens TaxID=294 RepID=UPI003748964A
MSLLHEIQASVLQDGAEIGPILLKLRLLAARLGSQPLAEWVRHESEGYPKEAVLPDYRYVSVSYTADFSGPFGSGIKNAPIAPFLIRQFAGEHWVRHQMRDSVAAIDELMASSAGGGGHLALNAADLILVLQGKVYEDYACNSVTGLISRSALASIRHVVSSRVLELTIELEKSIPEASTITLGAVSAASVPNSAVASQISQQIIYGNYTAITSSGDGVSIGVAVGQGDPLSLQKFLASSGMTDEDAVELSRLAATETPESTEAPMGPNVRNWLGENLKKAASGTWKMGIAVATDVIKEGLLKYYGLK